MTERRPSPVYASEDRMYGECKSRGGDTHRPHKGAFCAVGPRRPNTGGLITSTQLTRDCTGEQSAAEEANTFFSMFLF